MAFDSVFGSDFRGCGRLRVGDEAGGGGLAYTAVFGTAFGMGRSEVRYYYTTDPSFYGRYRIYHYTLLSVELSVW